MAKKYMRYLGFFLCSVVVLFILVTLVLPSRGRVVKEAFIPVERKVIMAQLTNLGNYGSWYPWITMDPTARIKVGTDGNSLSWKGAAKGAEGTYRIGTPSADSMVSFTLEYGSIPAITGAYILRTSMDGKGTTVVWYMNMKAGLTPWWRFYAAMLNKLTGPVIEAGLVNLKMVSQQATSYAEIPISDTLISRAYLATTMDTVTPRLQYTALSELFGRLQAFVQLRHLAGTGFPQAQFQVLSDSALKIRAEIPVSHLFAAQRDISSIVRPAERVLSADFRGRYKELPSVYKALSQAALRYPTSATPALWETYEDDAIPQSDTSLCQIRVFYPLRK